MNTLQFDDLDDFDNIKYVETEKETFPCQKCNGTGTYQNIRIHQDKAHCFACNGRGYFLTSPKQRRHNRELAAARKKAKIQKFIDKHSDLVAFLETATWSDFAQSLYAQITDSKVLSDRQIEVAYEMMEKDKSRKAQWATEKVEKEAAKRFISLEKINQLFENAKNSGLVKPKLRISSLILSLAPPQGINAGYIYVKDGGEYAGKISPEGKFSPVQGARFEIEQELIDLAEDPLAQAKAYGQRTGKCSCCGRKLTNKLSVELGIGPICRNSWGI